MTQNHSSMEHNLAQAIAEFDRLSNKLHLSTCVKEKAAIIYRKALERGLVRGRSINVITTASLYVACRITQTQRTLQEISDQSPIDKKDISKCYKLMLRELDITIPKPNAQLMIPQIAAKVGISERTQQKAVEILQRATELRATAGKSPIGLAATALYMACIICDEKHTQAMIANAAGITEITIRNRYRELMKVLGP